MLKFSDYLTIGLVILCFVWPMKISQYGMLAAFITRLFFVVLVVLCMMGPCGWVRRHKSEKDKDRLLALPVQTVRGTIPMVWPITKGEYTSIPTGHSIGTNGTDYYHYRYGTVQRPTGRDKADIWADANIIHVESLPKGFSDKPTTIPQCPHPVTISYVTDTDGTNYFISASQN